MKAVSRWGMSLAPEGRMIVAVAAGATLLLLVFGLRGPAFLAGAFTLLSLIFFRDPVRETPPLVDAGVVFSPADGRVIGVDEGVVEPHFLKAPCKKISIFMNLVDVHVNRIPISGRVLQKEHFAGKFFAADKARAAEENERLALLIETPTGEKVVCVQVAGLVARRILNSVQKGDAVNVGQRMGIIRFGSRCDIYLPSAFRPLVRVGDRVRAGVSTVAAS